jgi:hypothetical protein
VIVSTFSYFRGIFFSRRRSPFAGMDHVRMEEDVVRHDYGPEYAHGYIDAGALSRDDQGRQGWPQSGFTIRISAT